MSSFINPAKLKTDDYSGEWQKDMDSLFKSLNKFNTDATSVLNAQISLAQLGAQKITFNSVVVPDNWVTVPDSSLSGGWVSDSGTGPVGYCKDEDGWVYLRGQVNGGSYATTLFTLPSGFIPVGNVLFAVFSSNGSGPANDTIGTLQVTSTGIVEPRTGGTSSFSLAQARFKCSDSSPYIPGCFPLRVTSKLSTGTAGSLLLGTVVDQNKTGGQLLRPGKYSVSWHNETGFDGKNKNNNIVIDNISGLIPTHTYSITLWALPDQ